MLTYALIAIYLILLVFGFKPTWKLSVDTILAGSSGILFPILLFVAMIFIVGPVMGVVQLVKLCVAKVLQANPRTPEKP
ncbi:MAG TPA: hypothetical protein PKB13_07795 [Clostridia bacterium]|nr:hypothetical protein [Clostridia bacterium]